jgi:hypothetical protein
MVFSGSTRWNATRRWLWWACFVLGLLGAELRGQSGAEAPRRKLLDPRALGLEVPPGPVSPGRGLRVVTRSESGESVVARVHMKIGDHYLVILPDGQIVVRPETATTLTERPFVAADKTALAERLTASEFRGFKIKQSKHYLYIYNTSEEFALGTSRILESMLPGVTRFMAAQKLEVADPEVPLVVIMFRTEEQFQNYRRMPAGVVAYYHTVTNQVLMFEQSRLFESRPDLAIQQAISTIAHEGTHQILHNIGVQQRLSQWPMWISEGIAEFFAPTTVGKRLTWKGPAQVNDMRMFELEQYVKSKGAADPDGATVRHTVLAGRLTSTGYASAWALTHYLATKRRTEFNKYLTQVAQLGPLAGAIEQQPPGVVPDNLVLFEQHFGSDHIALEKKLVQHLVKLPYNDPFKDLPHFVAMFSWHDGRRMRREVSTFHSPPLAANWLTEMQEKNAAAGTAETRIRQFPNRLTAEQFARGWLQGG